jgi:hypothetical protein
MFGTKFKIWGWGGPVGTGAMASVNVAVHGIAKRGNEDLPYTVPSELICANLARAIRLPVPPSLVVEDANGVPFHVSMNFALAGENLPPADAAAVVAHDASLSAGSVLFDLWICNGDRHAGNLAFDAAQGKMMFFDHSHALFASQDIDAWLARSQAAFNIGGHCLAAHLQRATDFPTWNKRIALVPEYFIEGLVKDAAEVGLPADKVSSCTDFLLHRRQNLLSILKTGAHAFPQVSQVEWNQI